MSSEIDQNILSMKWNMNYLLWHPHCIWINIFLPRWKVLCAFIYKGSVNSGAHSATKQICIHLLKIVVLLYVISADCTLMQCAEDGCFPRFYSSRILSNPWLSDWCTRISPSIWGSSQSLISVDVLRWHKEYVLENKLLIWLLNYSGEILRISPTESNFSWSVLCTGWGQYHCR